MDRFFDDIGRRKKLLDVYGHLQDDLSRKIYKARSLFSLTDDREELRGVIREMAAGQAVLQAVSEHAGEPLVLFGAGTWGKAIRQFFDDVPWRCFVDNYKAGTAVAGLPVISVAELREMGKTPYVVNTLRFLYAEVEQQLQDVGIPKERVLALGRMTEEASYFDLPELYHEEHEAFADVGAYDGGSSLAFARWAKKYDHIYVFEPMKELQEKCHQRLADVKDWTLYPYGLWRENGTRTFTLAGENSNCSAETNESGEGDSIEVVKMDDVLTGKRVTYIKMDIEGSELAALQGAAEIIRRQHPKLAISVYHCRDDIWEIPKLLLSYHPGYRFYLRVYAFTGNDTVLYALP